MKLTMKSIYRCAPLCTKIYTHEYVDGYQFTEVLIILLEDLNEKKKKNSSPQKALFNSAALIKILKILSSHFYGQMSEMMKLIQCLMTQKIPW